jgi:hypothetical protein
MKTFSFFFLFVFCIEMTFAQSGWFLQNPLAQGNQLWGVCFTDANTGTAVGEGGTILRTTTAGVVWVQDENQSEIPNNFILLQNYPNPFNPSTSIQYEVGNRQFVQLKVYDILGNEVATLVN